MNIRTDGNTILFAHLQKRKKNEPFLKYCSLVLSKCKILASNDPMGRFCNGTVPLWALGRFGSPISLYEICVDVFLVVVLVAFLNYQVSFYR